MMKNIVKIVAVMAIACVVALKAYDKQNMNVSDVVLANVEALAELEGDNHEVVVSCSESCRDGIGKCWTTHRLDPNYCERSPELTNYCTCGN